MLTVVLAHCMYLVVIIYLPINEGLILEHKMDDFLKFHNSQTCNGNECSNEIMSCTHICASSKFTERGLKYQGTDDEATKQKVHSIFIQVQHINTQQT